MDTRHCEVACHGTANYHLGMPTKPKAKPKAKPRRARTAPAILPTSDEERHAIVAAVIGHIPAAGSTAAACRIAGVPRETFYVWMASGDPSLRDRHQAAMRATARHAVDVMAAITARAAERTLDATEVTAHDEEAHYGKYIAPLVRWRAEKILPEYAPRTETVSVRIDIRSTLAKLLDAADVVDADDLPALPAPAAPGDYAGD